MNRILYADDCLNVLNDPDKLPDDSVDLIYLDPPFNSNSNYNLPFKGKDKSAKPVEAFTDTWTWTSDDDERLGMLEMHPQTRLLASVVQFAKHIESKSNSGSSLGAYLLNMAIRLRAMRRVLKETGSIYLHCDAYASHYLKLVMDGVFGEDNFRSEVIWHRSRGFKRKTAKQFPQKSDTILFYAKSKNDVAFNTQYKSHKPEYVKRFKKDKNGRLYRDDVNPTGGGRRTIYLDETVGDIVDSVWTDIPPLNSNARERLGYPTQKPQELLERIVKASSIKNDLVLDPFCGCGTTVHVAEELNRRWIGIDISPFSTGLIRERIVDNFENLSKSDIAVFGVPHSVSDARTLASRDKFEFEKWVCGHIGAAGMFHEPGTPGADGGVDGLLEIYPIRVGKRAKAEYAIVQVKGGKVTPDAVKALYATVRRFDVTAGVLVCFEDQMRTVENQRSREIFDDSLGTYPVIQGYSIRDLLADKPLDLPMYGARRRGATLI